MTTYFVNHSGEDGTNGHNGSTEVLAWRTLAYAEDQLVAGDTVFVKADEAYTDADGANDCVLYAEKAGGYATFISLIGYTTTPGDNGRFTIDATGLSYGILCTAAADYRQYINMSIINATIDGFNGILPDFVAFRNSSFSANGRYGAYLKTAECISNCEFFNNADTGFRGSYGSITDSAFYNNSTAGCNLTYGNLYNCIFYGSASSYLLYASYCYSVTNCVFANSGTGIRFYRRYNCPIENNIFYALSTYAIYGDNPVPQMLYNIDYNCVYGCAVNYRFYSQPFEYTGPNDVLADPLFVDAANGDFRLRAGSPCIGAGVNGSDIGAYGFDQRIYRMLGVRASS